MEPTRQEPVWQVIGQSVRGASHLRSKLPNQDAILWRPETRQGPPLILVLSDGHGSKKSFRSDVGSALAVEQTAELLDEFVSMQPLTRNLSTLKRMAEERIAQELVRRWREAVDQDLHARPFTQEELERLAEQRGDAGQRDLARNPRLAYGATVLAAVVARDYLLFLQLGDGDLLTVMEDGEVVRPLERDARLFANETTSLCMERAWREVRLRFQARYGSQPALVMASTDGYANSFVNEAAFLKVGADLLDILRTDGLAAVEENLLGWLEEASKAGSGDDITLGLLFRTDVLPETAATLPASGAAPVSLDPDEEGTGAEVAPTVASEIPDDDRATTKLVIAQLKQPSPEQDIKKGTLADFIGVHEQAPGAHRVAGGSGVDGDQVAEDDTAEPGDRDGQPRP